MAVAAGRPTERKQPENPLIDGLERLPVPPTTLVIFGATGDLARRKLLPALYNLAHDGALPERFYLVGVSRKEKDHEDYRRECEEAIDRFSRRKPDPEVLKALLENVRYVPGTFDEDSVYATLGGQLDEFEKAAGEPLNRCLLPLDRAGLLPGDRRQARREQALRAPRARRCAASSRSRSAPRWRRRASSTARCSRSSTRAQVYRIDHYLGKETVQNLLAFRFANGMFEPLWNRNYIDYVQITAAEDIGIGTRAELLRPGRRAARPDPEPHAAAALPGGDGAARQLHRRRGAQREGEGAATRSPSRRPATSTEMAVRAQYGPGHAGGEDVPGYLEEEGVPADSNTETYAALRLEVDNWRWAGVPFYLRTGKRLARKVTEIAVTLKPVPHLAFSQDGSLGVQPNQLVLTVQPNEGVSLRLGAKIPGTRMIIRPVNMEFLYGTAFLSQSPEAYERLITDAMRGDATLFTRNDEVEAQWRICDPIVKRWEEHAGPAAEIRSRLAGPGGGRRRCLRDGDSWRAI